MKRIKHSISLEGRHSLEARHRLGFLRDRRTLILAGEGRLRRLRENRYQTREYQSRIQDQIELNSENKMLNAREQQEHWQPIMDAEHRRLRIVEEQQQTDQQQQSQQDENESDDDNDDDRKPTPEEKDAQNKKDHND